MVCIKFMNIDKLYFYYYFFKSFHTFFFLSVHSYLVSFSIAQNRYLLLSLTKSLLYLTINETILYKTEHLKALIYFLYCRTWSPQHVIRKKPVVILTTTIVAVVNVHFHPASTMFLPFLLTVYVSLLIPCYKGWDGVSAVLELTLSS